jgi:hypothetical protein
MKKSFLLVLASLFITFLSFAQNNSITGQVRYKNISGTPLTDSTIVFLYHGTDLISSDTVDANGYYHFDNVVADTLIIKSNSYKKPGGWNALDALLVVKHFVGMLPPLTGLNLTAADANDSGGTPGSVDALAIARRFTGTITTFAPASDWVSEKFTINIEADNNYTQHIYLLSRGDVNGSWVPNP